MLATRRSRFRWYWASARAALAARCAWMHDRQVHCQVEPL